MTQTRWLSCPPLFWYPMTVRGEGGSETRKTKDIQSELTGRVVRPGEVKVSSSGLVGDVIDPSFNDCHDEDG